MDKEPVTSLKEIFQDAPKELDKLIKEYLEKNGAPKGDQDKNPLTEEELLSEFENNSVIPDDTFINDKAPPIPTIFHTEDYKTKNKVPFMEKGIVGYLLGPSGVGKSHLLMQMAISIASGTKFLNKYIPTQSGKVIFILGEDRKTKDGAAITSQNRLQIALNSFHLENYLRERKSGYNYEKSILENIVPEQDSNHRMHLVESIKKNLILVPMANKMTQIQKGLRYTDMDDFDDLVEAEKTKFFFMLHAAITHHKPTCVILDPEIMFAGPDSELDPAAATRMIRMLNQLCALESEPTIIISSHPNKSSSQGKLDAAGLRGSGARTAASRWTGIVDYYWPTMFTSQQKDENGKNILTPVVPKKETRETLSDKMLGRLRLPKKSKLISFHVGNANESPSGEETRIQMVFWPDRRITRWPRLPKNIKESAPPDFEWPECNEVIQEDRANKNNTSKESDQHITLKSSALDVEGDQPNIPKNTDNHDFFNIEEFLNGN